MKKLTNDVPQFLGFTGVQSATDTYVAINLETGIEPSLGFGILARAIEFEVDFGNLVNPGQPEFLLHLQITKDAQTAILDLNNEQVLVKAGIVALAGGSSQCQISERQPFVFEIPYELPFVEDYIHIGFNTQGAAGTDVLTVNGRIIYDAVQLSEIDILRMRQQ